METINPEIQEQVSIEQNNTNVQEVCFYLYYKMLMFGRRYKKL
jgi:hypothetical protein